MPPTPTHLLLPLLLTLLPHPATATSIAAGCGKALPPSQTPPGGASHTVPFTQSDGTARTYLIHIPSSYDPTIPAPLIFSFHGRGKNASEQEALSGFSHQDWNPDGFAVYPQGLEDEWEGDPASTGVDDIGFMTDMIASLSSRYCIDRRRIYAAGKSNGGGFTGTLSCDARLSTVIAAFAPVSAALYVPGSTEAGCAPATIAIPCAPGRAGVPVLEFHGSADATIPYAGGPRRGECLPSIPHWVRERAVKDGLAETNVTTSLYGGNVLEYQYGTGSQLGLVTHYLTEGLGHAWPSTLPNDDNSAGTYYNATPIIMEFFNKYTL